MTAIVNTFVVSISINSACWDFFMIFCRMLIFFSKNSYRITIRVANSLDPSQARHCVGPDLDPNCLQRLSVNDIGR